MLDGEFRLEVFEFFFVEVEGACSIAEEVVDFGEMERGSLIPVAEVDLMVGHMYLVSCI